MNQEDMGIFPSENEIASAYQSLGIAGSGKAQNLGKAHPIPSAAQTKDLTIRISNHSVALAPGRLVGGPGPYRLTGLSNKTQSLR